MEEVVTDIPFKVGDTNIVIVKGLPVIQCCQCHEYMLADTVMADVERILGSVDKAAELEVGRYAAWSGPFVGRCVLTTVFSMEETKDRD